MYQVRVALPAGVLEKQPKRGVIKDESGLGQQTDDFFAASTRDRGNIDACG